MNKEAISRPTTVGSETDRMSDGFYLAFEERYRGSRGLIKERLRVYLPFLTPFLGLYKSVAVADLGCGRGEWLELLQEHGFEPRGVDLDEGMLKSCSELSLPAEKGEAVDFLCSLPSESQSVVSAFHVVEHITFEHLQTLVLEAFRVLKPGGLLILETPNPENILVSTKNFYLDPTHQRPIPPLLLSFLPEYYGFERVKILRLQESAELLEGKTRTLYDVLSGASPDYAVVAQKGAPPEQISPFDPVFQKSYGLTLETLAQQYETRITATEDGIAATKDGLDQIHNTWLWRVARWISHSIKGFSKRPKSR